MPRRRIPHTMSHRLRRISYTSPDRLDITAAKPIKICPLKTIMCDSIEAYCSYYVRVEHRFFARSSPTERVRRVGREAADAGFSFRAGCGGTSCPA